MRIDLHARVRTADAKDAGRVERAVIDPTTGNVDGFVVGTGGLLGRDLIVPMSALERASADGDAIRLALSEAEFGGLKEYRPVDYVSPPPEWAAPLDFPYPHESLLWPAGYAFHPVAAPPVPEGIDAETIAKGADVEDRDGRHIGDVEDVRVGGSGRLESLLIRVGGDLKAKLGGEIVELDPRVIERVDGGTVRLSTSRHELVEMPTPAFRRR